VLAAFGLLLVLGNALAEPPLPLSAQVETETPLGGVTAAATDSARRIVVTVGLDGAARVWSLPDLRLLRVLRAPLGYVLDNSHVAVAPDGSFAAAVAGRYVLLFDLMTGEITGLIPVKSAIGFENHLRDTPVNALSISPDGRRLAIGRGDNEDGCWLFITRIDGTELSRQCSATKYGDGEFTLAMSFAPDGRLAVATTGRVISGQRTDALTLLDADGHMIRTAPVPAWVWFSGLAFSPDGQRLGVAYWSRSQAQMEVRDGTSLALVATPDTVGLSSYLPSLSWSANSKSLLATGLYLEHANIRGGDMVPVYAWDNAGAGPRREAAQGPYRIGSMVGLPGGSMLMVANSGNLMITGQDGAVTQKYPDGADFSVPGRGAPETDDRYRLRLSRDGAQVELVTYDKPQRWLHVDVSRLTVTVTPDPQASLADWTTNGAAFGVGTLYQAKAKEDEDRFEGPGGNAQPGFWFWKQMQTPEQQRLQRQDSSPKYWLLNGRGLKFVDDLEIGAGRPPRTAVAGGRVVTVTSDSSVPTMRGFDLQGHPLWTLRTGSTVNRINLSADGRLVVAASSDGTIRWYTASGGRLILTLFIDRTADGFIFFTPHGYYYATPGAEKFVGFLIGRGTAQSPDFFSVGQLSWRYYRQLVVQHILDTLDESEATRQFDALHDSTPLLEDLPPVVAVTSPRDDSRIAGAMAQVDYVLRSPSGHPVREIRFLIDGRPVRVDASVPPVPAGQPPAAAIQGRILVPLPAGRPVTLSILAASDEGKFGPPATLRLTSADPGRPISSAPRKGRLFALMIGVRSYAKLPAGYRNLRYTAQDATALAEVLIAPQQRQIYDEVQVRLLVDEGAVPPTRDAILAGLRWLRQQATLPEDVALLFISSHGAAVGDARGGASAGGEHRRSGDFFFMPTDADLDNLAGTAVSGQLLIDELKDVPGHVLLMIDACYAGGATLPDTNRLTVDAASPWAGMFVYASSSYNQTSKEDQQVQHGVFTQALLDALHGRNGITTRDGAIFTDYLASFLAHRVPELGGSDSTQTPLFLGPPHAPDLRAFAVVN
jgi:WD40 repeat protein